MTDREKVMSWLEGLAEPDWRECYSDSEVQNIAKLALKLLQEQQQRIEALEIDIDILVKDINTKNCNTCKRECEHRPRLGETVRANCFMWEGT